MAIQTDTIDESKLNSLLGTMVTELGAQAGEKRLQETIRAGGFTHCRRAAETPFNMILEARV